MDFLALIDFNAVMAHEGFGKAARATQSSKATLSRRVISLEDKLGVRLLERDSTMFRPTEYGQLLYELTAPLLEEIGAVGEMLAERAAHPRGVLRVKAPMMFAAVAMGRIAADLFAAWPDIQLDVTADDRLRESDKETFDVVICVDPPSSDWVGRRLMSDHMRIVAAPSLPRPVAAEGGAPIEVPAVVTPAFDKAALWQVHDDGDDSAPPLVLRPALKSRLASFRMVRDAACAGMGVAMLPYSMIIRDEAEGRLVDWGRVDGRETELWVLYKSKRLVSRKIVVFIDELFKKFPLGTPEELAGMFQK